MSTLIKHEGVWKEPEMIYVKDQGVWKEVGGAKIPPIGEPFEGGYVLSAATTAEGLVEVIIIADKLAEASLQWKTSNTSTPGTSSESNGWANTNNMNNAAHPAAKYCRDYRGGGFDDWYLLSRNEFMLAWVNLGPNGDNTPDLFKTGGDQSFNGSSGILYATSTEFSTTGIRYQRFTNGLSDGANNNKTTPMIVRPARKITI